MAQRRGSSRGRRRSSPPTVLSPDSKELRNEEERLWALGLAAVRSPPLPTSPYICREIQYLFTAADKGLELGVVPLLPEHPAELLPWGIVVRSVVEEGQSYSLGLQKWDVIKAVGNRDLRRLAGESDQEYLNRCARLLSGTESAVTIIRLSDSSGEGPASQADLAATRALWGLLPSASPIKHVRVLWDIENVPIPADVDTVVVLSRLRSWLRSRGLDGQGVDCRITAVYCPGKVGRFFNNGTAHVLDRSGVEQLFCSRKVEDADRKILVRLHQEACVLPPHHATFVLVTGDLDFNTALSFLAARGFDSLVLCGESSSERTRACFALNTSDVVVWESIVCPESTSMQQKRLTRGSPLKTTRRRQNQSPVAQSAGFVLSGSDTGEVIESGDSDGSCPRDKSDDATSEMAWDLGAEASSELDMAVAAFIGWLNGFTQTTKGCRHPKRIPESALIGRYFSICPDAAASLRGHSRKLKSLYPELKSSLAAASARTGLSQDKTPANVSAQPAPTPAPVPAPAATSSIVTPRENADMSTTSELGPVPVSVLSRSRARRVKGSIGRLPHQQCDQSIASTSDAIVSCKSVTEYSSTEVSVVSTKTASSIRRTMKPALFMKGSSVEDRGGFHAETARFVESLWQQHMLSLSVKKDTDNLPSSPSIVQDQVQPGDKGEAGENHQFGRDTLQSPLRAPRLNQEGAQPRSGDYLSRISVALAVTEARLQNLAVADAARRGIL